MLLCSKCARGRNMTWQTHAGTFHRPPALCPALTPRKC